MAVLEAKELYRFFHSGDEEVKALRGVDFSVDAGEMVALMGPSGSGKSTLLMCLAGVDDPDGGMVWVLSKPLARRPQVDKADLRKNHYGTMLQRTNLIAHLSVEENVQFVQRASAKNTRKSVPEILGKFGIAERAKFLPAQLSGGERARASLAAAVASSPQILLLDEPTGEVDAATESSILNVLRKLAHDGAAIVMATHNPAVARAATRIAKMSDGRMIHV